MNNTSLKNLIFRLTKSIIKLIHFQVRGCCIHIFFNALDYMFIKKYYLHLIKDIQLKVGINIGN